MNTHKQFLASEYPPCPPEKARFHVIPVPFEATVSYGGGTAAGPAAILAASDQLEVYDGIDQPGDAGIYTCPAVDCDGSPEVVLPRVRDAVLQTLDRHTTLPVPVILGGEHSVTGPAVEAVQQLYHKRSTPIGLVQIDAHADLRREYEGSQLSHAAVVRRVHQDLEIPVIQLGVRSLSPEEVRYREKCSLSDADKPQLHWHDASELVRQGITRFPFPRDFPREVYLTVDVDGLDPSLCPATGTPVPGGFSWYQVLDLLDWITGERRVVGFDMVELAPIPGLHAADYAIAELTYRIMGMISRREEPSRRPLG